MTGALCSDAEKLLKPSIHSAPHVHSAPRLGELRSLLFQRAVEQRKRSRQPSVLRVRVFTLLRQGLLQVFPGLARRRAQGERGCSVHPPPLSCRRPVSAPPSSWWPLHLQSEATRFSFRHVGNTTSGALGIQALLGPCLRQQHNPRHGFLFGALSCLKSLRLFSSESPPQRDCGYRHCRYCRCRSANLRSSASAIIDEGLTHSSLTPSLPP